MLTLPGTRTPTSDKKNNLANLLLNVIPPVRDPHRLRVGGGNRLWRDAHPHSSAFFRSGFFDRREEMEFISLHLSEGQDDGTDSKVSSSIKAV